MEQFLYGLLAGVALGMWLAILLYTFAGRRQQRLTRRRRQARDAQLSAQRRDGRPADDFDDYYEQQEAEDDVTPVEPELAPALVQDDEPAPADVDEDAVDVVEAIDGADPEGDARQEEVQDKEGDVEAEEDVYQRLVGKADGDTDAAERLIDAERERTPAAPRAALIQNALDRLEYGPE